MKLFRYLFIALIFVCQNITIAQASYGTAFSNYSPSQTVWHNPASLIASKTWLDVHFIGVGAFLYNNYAFIPAKDFSLFALDKIEPDYKEGRNNYDLFFDQDLHLFSAYGQYKTHAFGFGIRNKIVADMRRIPGDFVAAASSDFDTPENVFGREGEYNRFYFNTLTYIEASLSYSNAFKHLDHNLWSIGGNLKYLMGNAGAGIKVDQLYYALSPDDEFSFINFDATAVQKAGFLSGRGVGLDFGVEYKHMIDNVTFYEPYTRKAGCTHYRYKWKFGAAITDMGLIRFGDAEYVRVTNGEGTIDEFTNNQPSGNNISSYVASVQNDAVEIEEKDVFTMLTPAAIQLQADYNFENGLYIGGQYTQGVFRRWMMGPKHPHVLVFNPRFESKWFEVALPFSLYNFEEVRSGIMFRFAYLTIGSDKLGTYLGISRVTGADIYVALAYKLYKRPFCEQRNKRRKKNESKCPKF